MLAPSAALAQTTAPPANKPAAAKPAPKTVEGVTVTGQGSEFRSSIDRRSYDVTKDLSATTGSIADALRNVPSVDVDLNGNVSLRGDANVTIMIDGKPSNVFKGPGGGQALQALPADQIARVEVITNPSAAFSPEGSAGIINLITKQGVGAGSSGSARANIGTAGRRNVGVSGSYNSSKLTLSGDAAWRHDPQHSVYVDDRTAIDPATGLSSRNHSIGTNRGPLELWNLRGGVDYDLDPATRIGAELRHTSFTYHPDDLRHIEVFGPVGELEQVNDHFGLLRVDRFVDGGQASFRRKFSGDDHVLTLNLSREHTDEHFDSRSTETNALPPLPDLFRDIRSRNDLMQTELKADYSRPMPAEGKLKTGYDVRVDDNRYDYRATRGTSAANAGPDLSQTNLFLYKQTINAAYATYEQPFGDWTLQGGLRLEDVRLDLDQATTGAATRRSDVSAYPSLHLAYKVSDTGQFIASYSHRIQRPSAQDLNPFRIVGTFDARQGNPNLDPQDTHSFELGWQHKESSSFYLATLYYRLNEHGVTDVVTDLGGGILLTTKQNLARSRNAGLELVANGKITKTLSYNASTNFYWNEIEASNLGLIGVSSRRSAFAVGGRASLNWQVTPKDLVQVSAQLAPKRLLPQGFSEPVVLMFLGYRHKFDDSLSFAFTTQDPFDVYRFRQVFDTPLLRERSTDRGRIQAAFVGLTWSFGAAAKKPQAFDFGGGSPQ
jgi:outer membrane cobalamin receptor